MADIRYPDEAVLRFWVELLSRADSPLARYLPGIDDVWFSEMKGVLERAQLARDEDLHAQATRIFRNAVKNHHFVDGNKRSGVIMLYLFYYWNDYELLESDEGMGVLVHTIAERLASIEGNLSEEQFAELAQELRGLAVPLVEAGSESFDE